MSTYFSRIRLNPTRSGTRRLLSSRQSMHAAVLGSHPGGIQSEEGRVLWRVDERARHNIELLVVSPTKPDFTGLVEQAGWPTVEAWDTTAYDNFLDRLTRGQRWRFRLTANPVLARKAGNEGQRGRVLPRLSVASQQEWFESRLTGWGLLIPPDDDGGFIRVENRRSETFGRGNTGARQQVSITGADFVGVLEVADAEVLRHHLTHGLGRAKAYGCGLMTLASLRQ